MEAEFKAIETVSRAVNRVTRNGRFADFELSNGIVLTCKPIPPLLLQAVVAEFKLPPAPKVFIEEKGREEDNPNDPDYIAQVNQLAEEQDLAINDLLLGIGTSIKYIPDGYFRPEDEDWITQVEFSAGLSGKNLRIEREDKIKRYLHWLRFYALETGADIALAQGMPVQLAGIREGEVEEVIDSFRGIPERGTDTNGSTEPGSENGDTANRATRRARPRDRRA